MRTSLTRRAFAAASAGAIACLSVRPAVARTSPLPEPVGPVYGRTGPLGIPPGSPDSPAQGAVRLLDGRVIVTEHVAARGVLPGKSVLLSPDDRGGWLVLYAEV